MNVTRAFVASLLIIVLGVSYAQPALCTLVQHDQPMGHAMIHVTASESPGHHGASGCHDMATCGVAVVAAVSDQAAQLPALPTHAERRTGVQQRAEQNPHSSLTPPPKP